jgi:hypothetical protein
LADERQKRKSFLSVNRTFLTVDRLNLSQHNGLVNSIWGIADTRTLRLTDLPALPSALMVAV